MRTLLRIGSLCLALWLPTFSAAQEPRGPAGDNSSVLFELPDLEALLKGGMRDVIERYDTELRSIHRYYDVESSSTRAAQTKALAQGWQAGLAKLDFESLDQAGKVDFLLLCNKLDYQLQEQAIQAQKRAATLPFLAFRERIVGLQESRRRFEPVDPQEAARGLLELSEEVRELTRRARLGLKPDAAPDECLRGPRPVVNRAASEVRALTRTLASWYGFFEGYDPLFSWWVKQPYGEAKSALEQYGKCLREELVGVGQGDRNTIIGDPIGRAALLVELKHEMIAYSPEELQGISEIEFAWCEKEMLKASEELGFGADWRAALEHVKGLHLEPGKQPELVRDLAWEAIDFLEEHELVTIPELAKHGWRMEMMSLERQKFTPFFTGGEVVSVAFPTDAMSHPEKLMSLRSNNIHFSRATVHHELIPGHHLQGFMRARHSTHRRTFGTPFWLEGWALYWEMLLWDLGFQKSPEDRVGMLFWRMHRCARILFSLGYELGELSPEECIQMLIERVGHEPSTAEAEVRRSVQGGYPPLYQAAYMLGGLQIRALHQELVPSGRMGQRAFHDAVLKRNSIPIEMLRAELLGLELVRDHRPNWRFYPN